MLKSAKLLMPSYCNEPTPGNGPSVDHPFNPKASPFQKPVRSKIVMPILYPALTSYVCVMTEQYGDKGGGGGLGGGLGRGGLGGGGLGGGGLGGGGLGGGGLGGGGLGGGGPGGGLGGIGQPLLLYKFRIS